MSLKNLIVTSKIPKIFYQKLKNKKIKAIYQKFEKKINLTDSFAVAVSGGPDSLALSFLAKLYSINNKISVKFIIIDHKLRNNSNSEVVYVNQLLKKIFIKAKILKWTGKKPVKGIQAAARKNRYDLLFRECKKYNIKNILLGHHIDDVIENFFIRLVRGSGLRGLVSLNESNNLHNFNILRPLVSFEKKDLIYLSKNIFGDYIKDPSNLDKIFKRVKIRNLIKKLEHEGLDKKKLILTINNLKSSNDTILKHVKKNLKENCFFSQKRNIFILNSNFFNTPNEVVFRSLSDCLKKIGGNYHFVRGKKLIKIINEIITNDYYKVTLGGCIIKKINQTVIITREN